MRKRAAIGTTKYRARLLLPTLLIFCLVQSGAAQPSFYDAFIKLYHPAAGSDLAKAGCLTCHSPESKAIRNAYGKSVWRVLNKEDAKALTPEMLIEIEKEDSDGDGYTNIEEIVSGTLPGIPGSHPRVHPTNLPKRAPKPSRKRFILYGAAAIAGIAVLFFVLKALLGRKSSSKPEPQEGS